MYRHHLRRVTAWGAGEKLSYNWAQRRKKKAVIKLLTSAVDSGRRKAACLRDQGILPCCNQGNQGSKVLVFSFGQKEDKTAAKSLQSCPTLCDPIDGSPPGSPIPGTLQARTLEWVAISFSNAWKWKVKGKLLSRVRLLVTPWTAVHQAPPSLGFSRQKYWSGVPLPSPGCPLAT